MRFFEIAKVPCYCDGVTHSITHNGGVATIQELRRWFLAQAVINGGGRDDEKDLTDDMVELLAQGICPNHVALRCWEMLSWKREHYRNEAREKATA